MADGAMIAFSALVLIGYDFRRLVLLDDFGNHRGSGKGAAGLEIGPCTVEKNVGESVLGTSGDIEFLDVDDVALGDAVLFTAGFEDCVRSHKGGPVKKDGEAATRLES